MSNYPLISCVCVTRNRVRMLRRAVACFASQTYPVRELVIVFESDDPETREYVETLTSPAIRVVEARIPPRFSLGILRNLAVQCSRGYYVAQWDDDDWYAPSRLMEQVGAIRSSGRPACVLSRWLMYDTLSDTAYLSGQRMWEGSLVVERSVMPSYPDLPRGEDSVAIEALSALNQLVALDRPDVYIYTIHSANTWHREHWLSKLRPFANPLAPDLQERVRQALSAYGE